MQASLILKSSKKIDISIFIVNLKKDKNKKEYIKQLCNKHNLQAIFVNAVYGKELSKDFINKVYSKDDAIKKFGRELDRGEIGCALSHRKIYEIMLQENISYALILEDDIEFDQGLVEVMKHKSEFPNNWEIVLLGHHGIDRQVDTMGSFKYSKKLTKKYRIERPCEMGFGTYGYLITLEGAKKLLDATARIYKPIDEYTGDDQYANLYIVNPAPIRIHHEHGSKSSSMGNRDELKRLKNPPKESSSIKKKIAKKLGIYSFLLTVKRNFIRWKCQLKPLRRYHI